MQADPLSSAANKEGAAQDLSPSCIRKAFYGNWLFNFLRSRCSPEQIALTPSHLYPKGHGLRLISRLLSIRHNRIKWLAYETFSVIHHHTQHHR